MPQPARRPSPPTPKAERDPRRPDSPSPRRPGSPSFCEADRRKHVAHERGIAAALLCLRCDPVTEQQLRQPVHQRHAAIEESPAPCASGSFAESALKGPRRFSSPPRAAADAWRSELGRRTSDGSAAGARGRKEHRPRPWRAAPRPPSPRAAPRPASRNRRRPMPPAAPRAPENAGRRVVRHARPARHLAQLSASTPSFSRIFPAAGSARAPGCRGGSCAFSALMLTLST